MSSPTRPTTQPRAEPDTGLLQPITDPSRDTFSLPPVSRTYEVQRGDTLTAIANKQGVPLSALLSANGLTRNSVIYVGQSLLIPEVQTGEGPAEYSSPGQQVVVARGDSLSSIAARHRTTVQAIKSLNGLSNDTIFVGQTLTLPVTGSPVSTAQAPSTPPSLSSTAGMTSYTVRAGDTPGGIASRHGISARELMALNNISDPRRLSVGQQLIIPGGSSPTGTTAAPPQQRQPDPATSAIRPRSETPATPPRGTATGVRTGQDPMSSLEALEDDDLPFVEVEAIEETTPPQN